MSNNCAIEKELLSIPVPLNPRITKSTSVTAAMALFPNTAAMLKRFEVAKAQANLWDGERDGLREAVKQCPPDQYEDVILTKKATAPVLYPNATAKYHIEHCLQSTVPAIESGLNIAVYTLPPEELLNKLLHELQTNKANALTYLQSVYLGEGTSVDNSELYKKEPGEKAEITILPAP